MRQTSARKKQIVDRAKTFEKERNSVNRTKKKRKKRDWDRQMPERNSL